MANDPDAEAPSTSYPTDGPFHLHATCTGHKKAVSSVRFSPSGQLLASVSADATLQLWRVPDGTSAGPFSSSGDGDGTEGCQQRHMKHGAGINDVAWNFSGNYLATASDDLSAKIWDAETGTCLSTMEGHTNYVFCCQFNPIGNILATGSFDETIRFWDVRSGRCLRELPAHSDPITALDFIFDGTVLASCSFDGLLRLWDTYDGHCLKTLAIDNGDHPLSSVSFSPNGRYLLQSFLNSKLRLVSFETGRVVKTYRGHTNTKFCSISTFVTTTGPRPLVASGSEDGGLFLWDVNNKQVVQHVPGRKSMEEAGPGHCGPVLCTAAHPTEPFMATAGHEPDCTVKLWSSDVAPMQE